MDSPTFERLLTDCRVIAVVGLSPKPDRPSFEVSQYMQAQGYRIVPINPLASRILGEPCYPSLSVAAQALATEGLRIAMVDCFRRSEEIPPIADEAIAIGAACLWMQIGVVHEAAAAKARAAGLAVVMDRCLLVEHARLRRAGRLN